MRKIVLSVALLALVGAPEAFAQGGSSTAQKNTTPQVQAPVGHRQPRASDVPNEKNLSNNPNDAIGREDAALDKKLKSICRGC